MISDLNKVIEDETEDIMKLESIIESKRQHISDAMKVLSALKDVDKL